MKKLIPFVLFLFFSGMGFSQKVNNVPLSKIKAQYIRVDFSYRSLRAKGPCMYITYGQDRKSYSDDIVTDDDGNEIVFNNAMDGINYLYENGFELLQIVTDTDNKIRYYMQRREKLE